MASADILRAAHSPLPWQADRSSITGGINNVFEPKGFGRTVPLTGFSLSGSDLAAANTEFVFRACNAHYQMLEALKAAEDCLIGAGFPVTMDKIRAAIAAAEAEAGR